MTSHLQDAGALVIFAVAVLAALARIVRLLRGAARKLDQLDQLGPMAERLTALESAVNRELTPNGGNSLRDDVTGLAYGVGRIQRIQDALVAAHQRQHPHDPIWKELP